MIRRGYPLVFLAIACAPDEPGRNIPPVVWSGEHLEFAPQAGAPEVCEGTLPYMDRYVELVADVMRVELDQPVTYVLGSEQEPTLCKEEGTLGCAFDDAVYSRVAPQEHELVHGVRAFEGFSHVFFDEGAAEVFGDDAGAAIRIPANGDLLEGIETAMAKGGLPSSWYPRAGHFAAYLHDHHGAEVTVALLQQTDPDSSAEAAIEVVEGATEMTFDELRVDYEAQPVCEQARYRYPLFGCDDEAVLRPRCDGDTAVYVEERIACDDATTVGPRDGEIWKYVAFEVPMDGEYLLTSVTDDGAAGANITVEECSMRCDSIVFQRQMGIDLMPEPEFLRAGRYSVRLTRPVDEPGEVAFVVRGNDCE